MIYDILPVNNYEGNGSTTVFDFDFYVENSEQLRVFLFNENGTKVELINEVDYEINELKNPEGSYITFPIQGSNYNVLEEGQRISLQLHLPISQETQYNNSSLLNLSSLEYSFDYLTRLIQILSRKIEMCIKSEEGSDVVPTEIINNIVSIGSSIEARAQELNATLTLIENLSQSATSMYNTVIQGGESINQINSTLATKANTSGDNFVSRVEQFDGGWIYKAGFGTDLSIPLTNQEYQFNIEDWLPDDDYNYEVLMTAYTRNNSSTTDPTILYVLTTSEFGGQAAFIVGYAHKYSQYNVNTFTVPIGALRKFSVQTSNIGTVQCRITLTAYRRLGTNV